MLTDMLICLVEWFIEQLARLIKQLERLDFRLLVRRLPAEERARLALIMRALLAERQADGEAG
jgi:hypothetical protein